MHILVAQISAIRCWERGWFECSNLIGELRLKIMENTFIDKTFRDSNGNIVIAQMPNLPLIVWFATSILSLILPTGNINIVFDTLATGSLFTWAWLELFDGVNYFRRALGLAALIGIVAFKIQSQF